MATPEETRLVLQIEANIKSLENTLKRAGVLTKQTTDSIEKGFTGAGREVDQQMNNIGRSVEKGAKQAQQGVRNLSFQLNDITQGLLSGTSPFTIMVQQAGQVQQAVGELGKGGLLKGLMSAFGSLLSPASLAISGLILGFGYLTQAAIEYVSSSSNEAEKADEMWKRHSEVISGLKEAYGDAMDGLTEFGETSKAVADANALAQRDAYQKLREGFRTQVFETSMEFDPNASRAALAKVQELTQKMRAAVEANDSAAIKAIREEWDGLKTAAGQAAIGVARIAEEFSALSPELQAMVEQADKGAVSFVELDEALAKAFLTAGPDVRDVIGNMRTLIAEIVKNEKATNQLTKGLDGSAEKAKRAEDAQKEYNKAVEAIEKIGKPALDKVQQVLEQHRLALANANGQAEIYAANLAKANALQEIGTQAAMDFANLAVGGLDDYAKIVSKLESGGRPNAQNPNSSASGLFQFINKTFEGLIPYLKSLPQFAGLTTEQIRAQKNNVAVQKAAFDEFTRQNDAILTKHGVALNNVSRYMAHVLGPGGATKLLSANPNARAADVLGGRVAELNPTLIGGRTVAETIAAFQQKVSGAAATVGASDIAEENSALREQATIRGEINAGIDQKVAKEEAALKFAELSREATKKAAEEGRTLTAAETAELKRQADEYGRIKGMQEASKQAESFEARIQSLREESALLSQQVVQLGASSVAIDQNKVSQEAANEALRIEQQLRTQGATVTTAQSQAILQQTTAIATAKAQMDAFQRSQKQLSAEQERYNQQIIQTAQTAVSGFVNDLRNGVSAGDAFRNMLDRVIDGLINMAIEALFAKNALGGVLGGMFGGGGIIPGLPFPAAPTMHGGGIVGPAWSGPRRRVSPALFANAPRLHNGLLPNEYPAILQAGEAVIPRNMVGKTGGAYIDNSSTSLGNISIDMSRSGSVAADNDSARQFGANIQKLIQAEIVRESRPGGLLRRVPA
jgi:hypothetical protein